MIKRIGILKRNVAYGRGIVINLMIYILRMRLNYDLLKQFDYDGHSTYSEVDQVKRNEGNWRSIPNKLPDHLTIVSLYDNNPPVQ